MKKNSVKAEQVISYECDCPNCGERIYSEYKKDWDIAEMVHTDQEIKCDECECEFYVGL